MVDDLVPGAVNRRAAGESRRAESLTTSYIRDRHLYVTFASRVRELLQQLCTASGLNAEITARAKESASLKLKLLAKDGYVSLSDVPDLADIRVVASYLSEVDEICDMIYREFHVIEDVPHGLQSPDAFGYASRHLVIRIGPNRSSLSEWKNTVGLRAEIQVRTILQHAWASISHSLDYKSQEDIPDVVRRKLFQVAALVEVSDGLFDSFRRDTQQLRETYESASLGGTWHDLPINLDSLIASFGNMPLEKLEAVLQDRGVDIVTERSAGSEADSSSINRYFTEIVSLSDFVGLDTLGQLAQLLSSDETLKDIGKFIKFYVSNAGQRRGYHSFTREYAVLVALAVYVVKRGHIPHEVSVNGMVIKIADFVRTLPG